jgi:Regulator of chromosome condensation (RCC1) repeat
MLPTNVKQLNDHQIQKLCCGKFHSLFLNGTGHILACGANNFGQLGTGCKSNYFTPTLIENIGDVRELSAWNYSAAITHNNELFVWGTGIFGEYLKPQHLQDYDGQFRAISVGGAFSILVDFENRAYSWGSISDSYHNSGGGHSTVPSVINTIDGKPVIGVAVGDSFAFMLGFNMRHGEDSSCKLIDDIEHTYLADGSINNRYDRSLYDIPDHRYGSFKHQLLDIPTHTQ